MRIGERRVRELTQPGSPGLCFLRNDPTGNTHDPRNIQFLGSWLERGVNLSSWIRWPASAAGTFPCRFRTSLTASRRKTMAREPPTPTKTVMLPVDESVSGRSTLISLTLVDGYAARRSPWPNVTERISKKVSSRRSACVCTPCLRTRRRHPEWRTRCWRVQGPEKH